LPSRREHPARRQEFFGLSGVCVYQRATKNAAGLDPQRHGLRRGTLPTAAPSVKTRKTEFFAFCPVTAPPTCQDALNTSIFTPDWHYPTPFFRNVNRPGKKFFIHFALPVVSCPPRKPVTRPRPQGPAAFSSITPLFNSICQQRIVCYQAHIGRLNVPQTCHKKERPRLSRPPR